MCDICHMNPCDCRCPNANEKIVGKCKVCGEDISLSYEYYTDYENNVFCSEECAMKYHGIKAVNF